MLEGFTATAEALSYVDLRDVWHIHRHSNTSESGVMVQPCAFQLFYAGYSRDVIG